MLRLWNLLFRLSCYYFLVLLRLRVRLLTIINLDTFPYAQPFTARS
jgi:hypothetical protein